MSKRGAVERQRGANERILEDEIARLEARTSGVREDLQRARSPLRSVAPAEVAGEYIFQNEFIFSGHTAVPFLLFLFFERRTERAVMLGGSLVMTISVLLTHNYYTVDVLSAYLVGHRIYSISRRMFDAFVHPLYLRAEAADDATLERVAPGRTSPS